MIAGSDMNQSMRTRVRAIDPDSKLARTKMPNIHDRCRRFVMIDLGFYEKPKGKRLLKQMQAYGWCRLKTVGAFYHLARTLDIGHLRAFDTLEDLMDATELPREFIETLIEIKWIRWTKPVASVIADRIDSGHANPEARQIKVFIWKDGKGKVDDESRTVPDKTRREKKRSPKSPLEIDRSGGSISSEVKGWTADDLPSDGKPVKEHLDGRSLREKVDELKRSNEKRSGGEQS